MSTDAVFFGATAPTAITGNAALNCVGSLVEGLSDKFKYMLVAGAVAGGGLTAIANAPHPTGMSIVRRYFGDQTAHPLGLLAAALPPTILAMLALRLLQPRPPRAPRHSPCSSKAASQVRGTGCAPDVPTGVRAATPAC